MNVYEFCQVKNAHDIENITMSGIKYRNIIMT